MQSMFGLKYSLTYFFGKDDIAEEQLGGVSSPS